MQVNCDKCNTPYYLSERQAALGSFTCDACGTVCQIQRPHAKEWQIQRQNGEVLVFQGLGALQEWIVTRKVNREDQISRSGQKWKRLGEIAELAPFFEEAERRRVAAALRVKPAYEPPNPTMPLPTAIPRRSGAFEQVRAVDPQNPAVVAAPVVLSQAEPPTAPAGTRLGVQAFRVHETPPSLRAGQTPRLPFATTTPPSEPAPTAPQSSRSSPHTSIAENAPSPENAPLSPIQTLKTPITPLSLRAVSPTEKAPSNTASAKLPLPGANPNTASAKLPLPGPKANTASSKFPSSAPASNTASAKLPLSTTAPNPPANKLPLPGPSANTASAKFPSPAIAPNKLGSPNQVSSKLPTGAAIDSLSVTQPRLPSAAVPPKVATPAGDTPRPSSNTASSRFPSFVPGPPTPAEKTGGPSPSTKIPGVPAAEAQGNPPRTSSSSPVTGAYAAIARQAPAPSRSGSHLIARRPESPAMPLPPNKLGDSPAHKPPQTSPSVMISSGGFAQISEPSEGIEERAATIRYGSPAPGNSPSDNALTAQHPATPLKMPVVKTAENPVMRMSPLASTSGSSPAEPLNAEQAPAPYAISEPFFPSVPEIPEEPEPQTLHDEPRADEEPRTLLDTPGDIAALRAQVAAAAPSTAPAAPAAASPAAPLPPPLPEPVTAPPVKTLPMQTALPSTPSQAAPGEERQPWPQRREERPSTPREEPATLIPVPLPAREPAPFESSDKPGAYGHPDASFEMAPPPSSKTTWIVALVAGGVLAALLLLFWFKPALFFGESNDPRYPQASPGSARLRELVQEGSAALARDSEADRERARTSFAGALGVEEGHPPALAGLLQVHSAQAAYLGDDEQREQRELDRLQRSGRPETELAPLRVRIGYLKEEKKRALEQAKTYADQLLSRDEPDALAASAAYFWATGDDPQRAEKLDRLRELSPKSWQADLLQAAANFRDPARAAEAEEMLRAVLKQHPEQLGARYLLARYLEDQARYPEASAEAEEILRQNPSHARAASLLERSKNLSSSPPETNPISALLEPGQAGKTPEDWTKEGDRQKRRGKYSDALSSYLAAISMNPKYLPALLGAGDVYLKQERPEYACAKYHEAYLLAADTPRAIFGLGECYEAAGNESEAERRYHEYLDKFPDGEDARAVKRKLSAKDR
jgi:tetratricopeptide (TPR) repeat protein